MKSFGDSLHAVVYSQQALWSFAEEIKASVAMKLSRGEVLKTVVIISSTDSIRPWTQEVTSNQVHLHFQTFESTLFTLSLHRGYVGLVQQKQELSLPAISGKCSHPGPLHVGPPNS